jgi:DNA-binding transcriptional LysR family regulator
MMLCLASAPVPIHVVYPRGSHLSRRVRAFVDWARSLLIERLGIELDTVVG